ncbi:MAG: calcium-binding protein, partial [Dongiaceae bacterium]
PPADFSGSIQLGVSATSTEASNGDHATTSTSFSVAVAAVADTPVVSSSNVSGTEDNSIALDLSAALADTDGSESLTVKITGVPSGATLSAGVKNLDESWSLTGDQLSGLSLKPPANFSGNINLGLTATATESANGGTASATSNFQVHVSPDADAVVLAASAALQPSEGGDGTIVSTDNNGSQKDALAGGIGGDKLVGDSSDDLIIGDYGATVELNISAALTDTDGSETVTVTLSGVPNGASLSAGTNLGGGSWLLTSAQLSGLTMSVPSGTSDFTLAVTATVTDKFGSETDTVSQTVSLNVPVASDGAGGDDEISGGAGDDTLLGGGGDDSLEGESGRDLLRGEAGDDVLDGGSGADTLDGGFGDDYAHGGEGDDTLLGGDGADTLNGHTGADLIEGGAGADSIDGGTGTDTASYASSSAGVTVNLATGTGSGGDAQGDVLSSIENLIGSAHADRLTGNSSNNDLRGGDGDDVLTGGGGVDNLYGEAGNDRLVWDSQDRLDGGSGFDIVDARGSSGGTIDLRNQTNIEAVQTGNGNDTVRISLSDVLNETSDNQFFAVLGGGSDTLRIDTSGGWTAVTPTATPGPESAGVDLGVDLTHLQVHSFTNGSATVSVFTDAEVVTT